jgi:hypothetical protein
MIMDGFTVGEKSLSEMYFGSQTTESLQDKYFGKPVMAPTSQAIAQEVGGYMCTECRPTAMPPSIPSPSVPTPVPSMQTQPVLTAGGMTQLTPEQIAKLEKAGKFIGEQAKKLITFTPEQREHARQIAQRIASGLSAQAHKAEEYLAKEESAIREWFAKRKAEQTARQQQKLAQVV